MSTSITRPVSRVRWCLKHAGVLLCIVLTACAGANANTSGASSDGASSGASSNGASSGDSSGGSADSSANSADSSANSADSSAASNESSEGTSGSTGSGSSDGSSNGSSQNSADPAPADTNISAVVAASALLLSTVAGIGFAIYGTVRALDAPRNPGSAKATAMYLSAQTHQLEQDLALGAGPVLDDLAAAAGVPVQERPRFGRLMRAHRTELLGLAERQALTPERALRFLHRVGEITWADPVLNVSARRALELTEGHAG